MSDINWKDGAVCFVNGIQRNDKSIWVNGVFDDEVGIDDFDDFRLNEIRTGDFIPSSELDTEKKYNEAVEVFGLFGFDRRGQYDYEKTMSSINHETSVMKVSIDNDVICNWHKGKRQLTYNQIIAIGKLKRMMLEREKSAPKTAPDLAKASSSKYEREITDRQGNIATVDVYDVLKAFNVTCPATQHAVKKLLCSGLRGHKDMQTDLIEAKESIVRAIELN